MLLKHKSDEVFLILQKVCHRQNEMEVLHIIQTTLKEFERSDLIWQPIDNHFSTTYCQIESLISKRLKEYYRKDLKHIENYWKRLGVSTSINMNNFYNDNITLNDRYKQLKVPVKSFADLFSTDHKQFVIVAGAGYGKSTIVNEIGHQWVNGEKAWTQKFVALFLFRLSDITQNDKQSLQALILPFLNYQNEAELSQLFADASFMKKCLFVFDGLDELQNPLCEEIENILYGKGAKLVHVIVTSRPCAKLENIVGSHLYIELNGLSKLGVDEHLSKFQCNQGRIDNDVRMVFTVPLFATIYCLIQKNTVLGNCHISGTIEKYVDFACDRYSNINPSFTKMQKNDLLLTLGQAAQKKFLFMKKINTVYPTVTKELLSSAIFAGLVYHNSTVEEFVFVHQALAAYFAAYYWSKMSLLEINKVNNIYVTFKDPCGAMLQSSDLFSCFLSQFNSTYKSFLWNNFGHSIPYFNEYDSLPKYVRDCNQMDLQFVPSTHQNTALSKIDFHITNETERDSLWLWGASFESGSEFECITKVKTLTLNHCSLNISPEAFFRSYNIQFLKLISCRFISNEISYDDSLKFELALKSIEILDCDCTVASYLAYIMSHCTKLNTFVLQNSEKNKILTRLVTTLVMENSYIDASFTNNWITEFENNKMLHISLQRFSLRCKNPIELAQLFEIFAKIITLKYISLNIDRNLSKSELNALALSFEKNLKRVNCNDISLKDEYGKEINIKKSYNCAKLNS